MNSRMNTSYSGEGVEMREIKFRGMSNEGKWVYGIYVDGFIVNGVVEATDEYIIIENWCPVDVDTVGQYTGFKDKKGTEIYEGDKLLATASHRGMYGEEKIIYNVGIVEWYEGRWVTMNNDFSGEYDLYDWSFEDIIVIGNIYENPEMLEIS